MRGNVHTGQSVGIEQHLDKQRGHLYPKEDIGVPWLK